jgi:hypothetical protein
MRYRVTIASPEPEERILEMIRLADGHSPILANVRNPINIEREVEIVKRSRRVGIAKITRQK